MKESDIRNIEIQKEHIKLVEKDSKIFFKPKDFIHISCPACGNKKYLFEFEKMGFKYVSCKNCESLFVNPRPPFEALKKFYFESQSTHFWIDKFFKPVAEKRREKIFAPRAKYVSDILRSPSGQLIGDAGAGFGLFLEELKKLLPNNKYIAIEPSCEMITLLGEKGLDVLPIPLEEIESMDSNFDVLTAFELIEHLFDPVSFFKKAHSLLKPGGRLFVTTLNCKGFDILLLREHSKGFAPPFHLNFFNTKSIGQLLKKLGFEIMEISTPGKLDWDIVEGMIKYENVKVDKFWDLLANTGSEESKMELQDWISKNNLSSHMRVIARKPRRKA